MTNINDRIREAVASDDIKAVDGIIATLLCLHHKNYNQCQKLFEEVTGLDADGFEDLMLRVDEADAVDDSSPLSGPVASRPESGAGGLV